MKNAAFLHNTAAIIPMLLASPLFAQPDSTRVPYERVQVVRVDSTRTADQLFAAARNWFSGPFKTARGSILIEDPVQHLIIGRGTMRLPWEGSTKSGSISFTVEVSTKPGRYRMRFYDLHHAGTGSVLGKTWLPAFDLGTIRSGDLCYDPGPARSNAKKQVRRLAHVRCDCADVILPQVERQLNTLSSDLELHMRKAMIPVKDDW